MSVCRAISEIFSVKEWRDLETAVSYSPCIVTMTVSLTVYEILSVKIA